MVRDLESLIEYLYLKFIEDPILDSNVIVNPTGNDQVLDKICIINKFYSIPDLSLAKGIINRTRISNKYKLDPNCYIAGVLETYIDDIKVLPIKNVFYFTQVPQSDEYLSHPCFEYLNYQLMNPKANYLPQCEGSERFKTLSLV